MLLLAQKGKAAFPGMACGPGSGSCGLVGEVSWQCHQRQTCSKLSPLQAQEHEEWKPLALMVAEFEASTPARFNHGPRAVQYVPPPQPDPDGRAAVSRPPHLLCDVSVSVSLEEDSSQLNGYTCLRICGVAHRFSEQWLEGDLGGTCCIQSISVLATICRPLHDFQKGRPCRRLTWQQMLA